MEEQIIQQEILLFTDAGFFRREYYEKTEKDNKQPTQHQELMEEACWNGMLPELLPGIIAKDKAGKTLLLWEIKHGKSFIAINLCDEPLKNIVPFSIDPYYFLPHSCEN